MSKIILVTGLLLLFALEILRVYFIMPFPGSQQKDTIGLAYWLDQNINWLRIVLLLLIAFPAITMLRTSNKTGKIILSIALVLYAVVFYMFNFRFLAEKMFYQAKDKNFVTAANNKLPTDKLVIGVEINGEAKAYPIQVIGYHHQVTDTIGNTPVMVTYCTVCRTGRVFSPMVGGRLETFRLVGMDHFNAMFEDHTTRSWWRQATGEAITGKLKGSRLTELPSRQMSLAAWVRLHPTSTIMQGDTSFKADYKDLEQFDNGTIESGLEKRDSLSWKDKSWVIGIDQHTVAKAYDWNELVMKRIIDDSLPNLPLVIALETDTTSFHVWNRNVHGASLKFMFVPGQNTLMDSNTHSSWNMDGLCVAGSLKGIQLQPVQAYQEFWHSWKTFHPNTKRYPASTGK